MCSSDLITPGVFLWREKFSPLQQKQLLEEVMARLKQAPLYRPVMPKTGKPFSVQESNFGALGEPPTHPELLDYLASRFIDSGWSIKAIHREIMLSAVYQSSSRSDAAHEDVDADNRLLWRMNRHRLEVESWRDAMLAVSGNLDPALGGPSTDLNKADNRRRTL